MLRTLSADMERLFADSDQGDVIIRVQEEEFRCHMVVLTARSTYFRSLFQSGLNESQTKTVHIPDISSENFRKVLKFLYCGQLPEDLAHIALDLIPFADKYLLEGLKAACELSLQRVVSSDNLIETIVLAHVHRCPDLFKFCVPLFKENVDELKENPQWNELLQMPDLLSQLLVSCIGTEKAPPLEDGPDLSSLSHLLELSKDLMTACGAYGSLSSQV